MEIDVHFNQDEALLRQFYTGMYCKLPIYKREKQKVLKLEAIVTAILFCIWVFTQNALFSVAAILGFIFFVCSAAASKMTPKKIKNILGVFRKMYGKDSVACVTRFKDDRVVLENECMDKNYALRYKDILDAAYDSGIFCFSTDDNVYFFPLSAVEDKDALIKLLSKKNPSIRVAAH